MTDRETEKTERDRWRQIKRHREADKETQRDSQIDRQIKPATEVHTEIQRDRLKQIQIKQNLHSPLWICRCLLQWSEIFRHRSRVREYKKRQENT